MIANKAAKFLTIDFPNSKLAKSFYEKSKAARKYFVLYVTVTGYISFHFPIMYWLSKR